MKKRNTIIYWIATGWLALGMISTGVVQLMGMEEQRVVISKLGYPLYFLTLLGVWKIAGVMAILIPKFPILKEWAYAGFFFAMSGAIISHIASGTPEELFGSSLLLVLTLVSWYFRPQDRRVYQPVHN